MKNIYTKVKDACIEANRLKQEGKRAFVVMHNDKTYSVLVADAPKKPTPQK